MSKRLVRVVVEPAEFAQDYPRRAQSGYGSGFSIGIRN
jgi:hypothetical protein